MGENVNNISSDTKIIFTIKSFLATIGSILTLFVSFYFMVIDPRIDKAEENAEKILETKMEVITTQFDNIKELIEKDHGNFQNGIKSAIDASTANTQRFKDVSAANISGGNSGGNSGGSAESTFDD